MIKKITLGLIVSLASTAVLAGGGGGPQNVDLSQYSYCSLVGYDVISNFKSNPIGFSWYDAETSNGSTITVQSVYWPLEGGLTINLKDGTSFSADQGTLDCK